MPFRITSDIPCLSTPTPAGPDVYQFESKGFAPAPTSIETLRHIADSISGDGAFIMQGILRRAADDLERAREDAIEECALAAWKRGIEGNEPGTMINRRVIAGLIADDIRALKAGD